MMASGRQSVGHPIDVATGVVHNTYGEVSIAGKVRLDWKRFYSTALIDEPTPLGTGCFNRHLCSLEMGRDHFFFKGPDGARLRLDDPDGRVWRGDTIRNLGAFTELWMKGTTFIVCQWNVGQGDVWRYLFEHDQHRPDRLISPLRQIQDPTGHGLEHTYDDHGRLSRIRQKLEKRSLLLGYSTGGLIDTIEFESRNAATRQTLVKYQHDEDGRLTAATDAAGYTDYYHYDRDGRIVREVNKDGSVFTFRYDDRGRCVRAAGLNGYDEKTLRFVDAARCTEVTDSLGNVRLFTGNANGQIVREVSPINAEYLTEYDEHGRISRKTDPNGHVTSHEYDDRGNLCTTIDALGQVSSSTFNDCHQPLTLAGPDGNPLRRIYDRRNRVVAEADAAGHSYDLRYDSHGSLTEITDPLGNQVHRTFSADGVLEATTDCEGHRTRYSVDVFGRLAEIIDPMGHRTRYRYDAMDRVTRIDYADHSFEDYEYDPAGNVVGITGRSGDQTRLRYGPCNRLLEQIDPIGRRTRFAWGSEPGRLEKVVRSDGRAYCYEHNAAGWITSRTGFDGKRLQFEYDRSGNRIARINSAGERIEYERDALGRLVKRRLPDGGCASFEYDAAGFVIRASNADSDLVLDRDPIGRVVLESQNDYVLRRRYDAKGNLQQLDSPSELQINYKFDKNGLLSELRVDGYEPIRLERDARGAEVSRALPARQALYQEHDAVGKLIQQSLLPTAADGSLGARALSRPSVHRRYGYNRARLSSLWDAHWGETEYRYDAVERLATARRDRGTSESFEYDESDNATSIEFGRESSDLTYGAGDSLQQRDDIEFVFDEAGRLTRKREKQPTGAIREWIYRWDALDQLRCVTNPDGETWCYFYDALGRRIEKRSPDGHRVAFVWNEDVVLEERVDGALSSSWVHDPHSYTPLCKVEEGRMYSVISDHLGTPRELVDDSGQIAWRAEYGAWGEVRGRKQPVVVDCPVRFQGQWWDAETGLHYSRFRYYDPQGGRFISQDPIGIWGGQNLYRYCANPINWIDPLGLCPDDPDKVRETYDTLEAAVGDVYPLEHVEVTKTKDPGLIAQGFTEKHTGLNSEDVWMSAFRNPTTGKFTGGHESSRNY
jgi:RHS repeat-associated protein